MLAVLFNLGDQRRGLDSALVERVAPAPPGRGIAGEAETISYRGQSVPVLDLALRSGGRPANPHLSTRIILVRHPDARGTPRLLGLLAEGVNEVRHLSAPVPGIPAANEAKLITLAELFPADWLAQLPVVEVAADNQSPA
jgi:chemotaxis signal transduction protein